MDDEMRIGAPLSPVQAMHLAIQEGKKGAGFVAPNPMVGCTVLDREHKLLAVGYHRRLGGAHAEVDALNQIKDPKQLEGAHFFVTLEPCAHQNRTPSCARTLAPLKLGSVTYALEDPNPLVAGKGAQILIDAGVETKRLTQRKDIDSADREALIGAAEDLAEIFLHNYRFNEMFVGVKVASSLDGMSAMQNGESKWISNELSRQHVHLLRARYDAILIGRNTFVADNPSLNVRHKDFPEYVNRVVLFDPMGETLRALATSNLLKVRPPGYITVVISPETARAAQAAVDVASLGIHIFPIDREADGTFVIKDVLSELKKRGMTSLLVEGGAYTYAGFFKAKAVQRLHTYVAPTLIGGKFGVPWSSHFGGSHMTDKIKLKRIERIQFGDDQYFSGRIDWPV